MPRRLKVTLLACVALGLAGWRPLSGAQPPTPPPLQTVIVKSETKGFDQSAYARQLQPIIWRAWLSRLLAEAKAGAFGREQIVRSLPTLEGTCEIRFVLARDGSIHDEEVVRFSGLDTLDGASFDALAEGTFPPLPKDSGSGEERMTVRFVLPEVQGEARLLEELTALQVRGWF